MFRHIESSSGDTLTNLILLNYGSYMDPYIILIINTNTNTNKMKNMALLSLSLITFIYTDEVPCFYSEPKLV
jgi:hypothetical protein